MWQVLRGVRSKDSRAFARWFAGCKGNQYTTSIHCINSAIHKCSQLTCATTVYRGVAGGVLPASFWHPNAYDVRGGVEWAFLSCTRDCEVAFAYAASKGSASMTASVVLELQQGMVDRGADISWLSQYPFEAETTFPPLTLLEAMGTGQCVCQSTVGGVAT